MNDVIVSSADLADVLGLSQRRVQYLLPELPKKNNGLLLFASIKHYIAILRNRNNEGSEAKKRLILARAEQEEIKRQKLSNSVIPVDDVQIQAAQVAGIVKSELLAIPLKFAMLLENKTKEEIHKILQEEVTREINIIVEKLKEQEIANETSFFANSDKQPANDDI